MKPIILSSVGAALAVALLAVALLAVACGRARLEGH